MSRSSVATDCDFLFDPAMIIAVRELGKKTFGAMRHHTHRQVLVGEHVLTHFFEVYQVNSRGLPEVIETGWSRFLPIALANAMRLEHFPTERELEIHGL